MTQQNMNQFIMPQYIIVHCKHEGCYNPLMFRDEKLENKISPIHINPPKIFLFDNKPEAKEFFTDYINDVDVLDERCKHDEDINHIDHCSCGIVHLDDETGEPNLFYNQKNQIFLLEPSAQIFAPPHFQKIEMANLNLINSLVRTSRTLRKEQQRRYVELGKRCEEYLAPTMCQPVTQDTPQPTTQTTTTSKPAKKTPAKKAAAKKVTKDQMDQIN
jgi:hypothetical protein